MFASCLPGSSVVVWERVWPLGSLTVAVASANGMLGKDTRSTDTGLDA